MVLSPKQVLGMVERTNLIPAFEKIGTFKLLVWIKARKKNVK